MGKWTESKDNRTRDRILDAAERLIGSQGPAHAAPDRVAREACIPVCTLYQHFSGRESLCAAVAARIVGSLNRATERQTSGLKGFRKLRASCAAITIFRRDHPEKMAVLENLRSVKVHDPCDENLRELHRLVGENQQVLAEAVKESGGEGTFVAGIDPLATGQFLRMALQDACGQPPVRMALLDMCGTRCGEDFLKNTRDPLYRSILAGPDN